MQIGAAIPDQTSVEMRAQFRKRINPTPLAIPNNATARNASIIRVAIKRTVGTIGGAFGTLAAMIRPTSANRIPITVKTLPRMAITPEAVTAADRWSGFVIRSMRCSIRCSNLSSPYRGGPDSKELPSFCPNSSAPVAAICRRDTNRNIPLFFRLTFAFYSPNFVPRTVCRTQRPRHRRAHCKSEVP